MIQTSRTGASTHEAMAPDRREVVEGILADTGVDLFDANADDAAASASSQRVVRQVAGAFGGSLFGGIALISVFLTFVPGDASLGLRIAFGVIGVVFAAGSIRFLVWGWRNSVQYRKVYLKREAGKGA
jgi:hypothetical protein